MLLNIQSILPPLKKDLPLLKYDISLYCNRLLNEICGIWPKHLGILRERVVLSAAMLNQLKPNPRDIDQAIRVYILDHRMHLLFVMLDETGKDASFVSKFCAQYKKYDRENYYYGDFPDSPLEPEWFEFNGEEFYTPPPNELFNFNDKYGFVPTEWFAAPVVLIFQGDSLEEVRLTTMEHCVLLMEKFHSKNLVDLRAVIKGVPLSDATIF